MKNALSLKKKRDASPNARPQGLNRYATTSLNPETEMEGYEDGVVPGSKWLPGSQRFHQKSDATHEAERLA